MYDGDELDELRRQLLARFDAHPVKEWSPRLIRLMIAAFDLNGIGGDVPPEPINDGRPRLRLVQ